MKTNYVDSGKILQLPLPHRQQQQQEQRRSQKAKSVTQKVWKSDRRVGVAVEEETTEIYATGCRRLCCCCSPKKNRDILIIFRLDKQHKKKTNSSEFMKIPKAIV